MNAACEASSSFRMSAVDATFFASQDDTRLVAELRTADAVQVDDELIVHVENSMMKLSETIGSEYLTHYERSEIPWEALG